MKTKRLFFILIAIFISSLFSFAQTGGKDKVSQNLAKSNQQAVKSSPAYAELLLRKTELAAQVEDMLVDYTEDYPKLKESRYGLGLINRELEKLLAVNPAEASKLTLALGKLLLRKADLETDHWTLLQQYNNEHPDVKRAKRKIETFEKAIKEVLQ